MEKKLLTPKGNFAGNMDRIMLLVIWAKYCEKNRKKNNSEESNIIFAGIGKPTYPVNDFTAKFALSYWNSISNRSHEARHIINNPKRFKTSNARDEIVKINGVIGYGDPQGDIECREEIALAYNKWYGEKADISAEDILFTVGGAAALYIIFKVINKDFPKGRIITPSPYYSLYSGFGGSNRLHTIDLMKLKGYRLTAEALEESILDANKLAEEDDGYVSAFLFCDPCNPLGIALSEKELLKIAKVLRNYPKIWIILDEAYAEMRFDKQKISLLKVAPDLRKRIILIRSGTKALSSAGERMATIVTFNNELMDKFLEYNISICRHTPRSLQKAFSLAMNRFDDMELSNLKSFYQPQVELVVKALKNMSANMPDLDYTVNGTFYVMADLSDLFGLELPKETEVVFGKGTERKIETDEDIAYYLLFEDGIMLAPLSYFGINPKLGFIRITCSAGDEVLENLMNKLESRLVEARKIKQSQLESTLSNHLKKLQDTHPEASKTIKEKIQTLSEEFDKKEVSAAELKKCNQQLLALLKETQERLGKSQKGILIEHNNVKFFPQKNFKELSQNKNNQIQFMIKSNL